MRAAGKTVCAMGTAKGAGATTTRTLASGSTANDMGKAKWSGSMPSKRTKENGKMESSMEKEQVPTLISNQLDILCVRSNNYSAKWHGVRNAEYTGSWKNGQRDGTGAMTYGDGSYYNGEWKEDKKWGEAEVVSTNEYKVAPILFEVRKNRKAHQNKN